MGDALLDYSRMKTYSIKDRQSKVDVRDFSAPWTKGDRFSDFLSTLPSILAGNDLRSVIDAVSLAAKNKKTSAQKAGVFSYYQLQSFALPYQNSYTGMRRNLIDDTFTRYSSIPHVPNHYLDNHHYQYVCFSL